MKRLILYTRRGCHLCDEMLESLEGLLRGSGATVEAVDVDTDPDLVKKHGLRVPVLAAGAIELSVGRLEPDRVRQWLET